MKRQVQVRSFRIGCNSTLNKFGDYDVIVHVQSRPAPGSIPDSMKSGGDKQTMVMLSSVGAPPHVLTKEEFDAALLGVAWAAAETVNFPPS